MTHSMGRRRFRQRFFVALVVLLHKPAKHPAIIYRRHGVAVLFEKQEIGVPVDNERLCTFAVFYHPLERLIHFLIHGDFSDAALGLGFVDVVADAGISQKLVAHDNYPVFKIQIHVRQSAQFRNAKPCPQQNNDCVIMLLVNLITLDKGQETFFLCWCKRHLGFRIVVQNVTKLEVKRVFSDAIVLYGGVKSRF